MKALFLVMVAAGLAVGFAIPVARPPAAASAIPATPGDAPVETVIDRDSNGHFYAFADVNDQIIRFVVDTGATTVALTKEDAKRARVDFDPAQFVPVGQGAGGEVRGQVVRIGDIVLDGKRATDVSGVVLEGAKISLLGQSYLRRIDIVEIKADRMRLR